MSEGPTDVTTAGIGLIRTGSFSGSGPALRDALSGIMPVDDYDALSLTRSPGMLPHRLAALREARREGRGTPWTKTGTWARAVERRIATRMSPERHTLFVQTLLAPRIDASQQYSVYTDRVGGEGASLGGEFRSRFSPEWLRREKDFLRGARHVFVMGPSTKAVLVADYGVNQEKIHVVGAGVNCPLGPPVSSSTCRRLLFVGIDWRRKGLPLLADAFQLLRRSHPDLELTVVGADPDLTLPEGVSSVGRVAPERLDHFYSNADVFVMPTNMEAFGIVFTEAIIKGLPCIGTTTGNQQWLIGDAGICIEPGGLEQLADALHTMIENYESYATNARSRGRRMRSLLSWNAVARTIIAQLGSHEPIPDIDFRLR